MNQQPPVLNQGGYMPQQQMPQQPINQGMNQPITQGPVFQPPFQNQPQSFGQNTNNPMPVIGMNGSEMQPDGQK